MNNIHITEFLNYYITEVNNPQYAVLLKGKWGSGKTYFINEYKKSLNDKQQKYIYVSLYGVTSYDEVETKFLQSLNPKVFNEKALLAGKIAQAFVDNKIVNSFNYLGKLYSKLNSGGKILIFDDIERCSIKITDLLGYINYFVEHQSYKVILIANEEELEKTDKYTKIKEKLIGKTFEFKIDVDQAYDCFVKEFQSEEVFKNYKNIIIDIFKKSECDNLRLLRQGLFDFKRIYDLVLKDYIQKDEFIKDFITLYFIFIFETRSDSYISIKSLIENSKKYWEKVMESEVGVALGIEEEQNEEKNIFDRVYKKYNIHINYDVVFSLETWKDVIEDSYFNIAKIKDEILKSKYFIDENTESWKRLWSFIYLDDDNFDIVFDDVLRKLNDCKYQDLSQVMLISSTLLNIKRENLTKKSLDELYNILKRQIDYIFENKLVENKFILNENFIKKYRPSYEHLGFDIDFLEYKEISKYIEDKIKKEKEFIFKNSYFEIEDALKNDSSNLYTLFSDTDIREIRYYDKPVFAFIDIDKLYKILVESSSHSQYTFGGIIEDRYKHEIFTLKLESEFKNIDKLKQLIENKVKEKSGKISGYRLKENLLKSFEKAIEDIEKYKSEKNSKTKSSL